MNDQSALRIDIQNTVQAAIETLAITQVLVGNGSRTGHYTHAVDDED